MPAAVSAYAKKSVCRPVVRTGDEEGRRKKAQSDTAMVLG